MTYKTNYEERIGYKKHRDKILEYKKMWRKKNKEYNKSYYATYYQTHKKEKQESNNKWKEKHPEYHAQAQKKFREKYGDDYRLQKRIFKQTGIWMPIKEVIKNRTEMEKWRKKTVNKKMSSYYSKK